MSLQIKILTLKSIIRRLTGIDLSNYKDDFIERRLHMRMSLLGIKTIDEYIRYINTHPNEVHKLLEALAINVSEFFRDGARVWNRFADIIRSLTEQSRFLRIWSAGCAHGEEPYTISIILHEILGSKLPQYMITIYATDIDVDALRKAQEGVYSFNQVKNVPPSLLSKYFLKEGDKYRIKPSVKKLVRFLRHDLLRDPPLRFIDFLVCRNVLIYFSRDAQVTVLRKFYEALKDRGYLMLGLSEAIFGELEKLFVPIDISAKIYAKRRDVAE